MMQQLGVASCVVAGDATEGFEKFQQHQPGLIIIDLHLPGGISGVDLLKRVRAVDTDAYAIILTCEAASSSVMAALAAGADGYIRKDTPKEKILDQIREVLADPVEDEEAD